MLLAGFTNVVDIFNASSGRWSTAALSVARDLHSATSLPNQGLAIFAGGKGRCFDFFAMGASGVLCVVGGWIRWGGVRLS